MRDDETVWCADALIMLGDTFVVIERLTDPHGLALPGGKVDPDETPEQAVIREVGEETGLVFLPAGELGTYDASDRDPRGRYVSTVLYGSAAGVIAAEREKTRVVLLPIDEFERRCDDFVADHASIIGDYLRLVGV